MAGRLYPVDSPRPTGSFGEIAVYEALKKGLPDGWTAWHSVRLRVDGVWEGEGDFVVAAPRLGLLVIEVKGGRIELQGGHWLQNGRRMDTPPRDQGLRFAKKLAEAIIQRGAERPPFGVVSMFPETEFSQAPATGDLKDVVLGQRDLTWLGEALTRAAERAIPAYSPPQGARWMQVVHELWGETWVPHVRLEDRVDDAEQRVLALNADQLRVLDASDENVRAVVTGGAGTGKTIVGAELCKRWTRRGKEALFLCFTDALAKVVDDQFAREFTRADRPRAASLRKFAVSLLERAGHVVRPDAPDFWKEVALQAACDALPPDSERPDLVVVDEGQDLEESDWMLVEQLSRGRGLWVFHDPLQAFWRDRPLPDSVADYPMKLKLPIQVRCPEVIARFAANYGDDVNPDALAPLGSVDPATLRVVLTGAKSVPDRVRHELDELRKNGARPSDIAIVTLGGQLRSQLFGESALGSHRLVHADQPDAAKNVIADTFLRFKGLERPFVIITELDASMPQYLTRMRIALTRATVGLTIVCSEEQAKADPRIAALVWG